MKNDPSKEPKQLKEPSKKLPKCEARDVGHRSCKCGGPYCGPNAFAGNRR